jgi:1-phosphofructokinase family hexose kinase
MLIAGPNLTIDRTIRLVELRPGEVIRASAADVAAGGKGVNVVKLTALLGGPAELVAFLPDGRTGAVVEAWLAEAGVALQAVPVPGEVRSAAIMLEDSGRTTVLNEPGPPAAEPAWRAYTATVAERLAGHRVIVCSGSTPPASPDDGYARVVRLASGQGLTSIVDATGASLAAALEAAPDLVTPNLAEAEELLTGRADHLVHADPTGLRSRATEAAAELVRRGARAAIVTVGAAGVALARAEAKRWFDAPAVEVRNAVGAGDALVAGLGCALENGEALERAVLAGMASAAASVEQELPGRMDLARVEELRHGLA